MAARAIQLWQRSSDRRNDSDADLVGDGTNRGDLKILNRALKELRQAFKVFTL